MIALHNPDGSLLGAIPEPDERIEGPLWEPPVLVLTPPIGAAPGEEVDDDAA